MKKLIFVFAIISSLAFTSCDKETVLSENEVPAAITTFVTTHFPSNKVLQTIKDKDGLTKSYDVILEGNIQLEFNRKHEITSVESTTKLPDSVIPAKILTYVTANYANNFITQWELDDNRQKVELNNQIELEFNKAGDFVRID